MSLTSPKLLPAPAMQWIHGKREGLGAAVSEVCACSPGVAWETATLGQCCPFASHSHQLSPPFPCVAKNICTYNTLLHVGCIPSVVLKGKGKTGRKEKLFPVILCFRMSSSGLCSPARGLAAPEREVGSWNCALCRGFL